MTPLASKLRESNSHEWRRRSLVRVRRPAWSEAGAEAVSAVRRQTPQAEASSPRPHTTHNDIAW
jgi:hypothetical protein